MHTAHRPAAWAAALLLAVGAMPARAEAPSLDARRVAAWAADGDAGGLPFLVIDKPRARLQVYAGDGRRLGDAPVLLGLARGDVSVPGIGERPLAAITPAERTTPAGRFLAEKGVNAQGEDILWIDYEAAVSLHRVRVVDPAQRRARRLATPSVADNRITYGCVNVPRAFYDEVVLRALGRGDRAMVYVLPDRRPLLRQFPAVAAPARGASP